VDSRKNQKRSCLIEAVAETEPVSDLRSGFLLLQRFGLNGADLPLDDNNLS